MRPSLELDHATATLVGDICRKLDGLPLALELAAARVRHLPLAGILGQLEHRLDFLIGGALDLPLRQRAIRDTVGWSHDLLDPQERALLRRLSVFAGGFTLDAVRAVAPTAGGAGGPLDCISALVDQSLLVLDPHHAEPRYDMLDVVREYAAAQLTAAGETADAERLHARHYLALAQAAEPHLVRTGHQDWFGRLDAERGNLRRGLAWTIDHHETGLALGYILALWRYWRQLGELTEGRRWCDAALAFKDPTPPSLRAKALCAAAALAFPQGDHQRMAELATEAIALAHDSDDPMDLRNALTVHGFVAMCQGRYADALDPYRHAVTIARDLGISWQLATSELNLATSLLHTGHEQEAVSGFHEALRLYRHLGDDVFAARALNHLAHAALGRNDFVSAQHLARDALASLAEQGEPQGIAEALETLAAVAAARSEGERAATLAGAAAAIRESIAARAAPFDVEIPGRLLNVTKATMKEQQWQRLWEQGHSLIPTAAVQLALTP